MPLMTASPKARLIAQINAANTLAVPVTETNLYFGKPSATGVGSGTTLPTTAVLGADFTGYRTFMYPRLDLSQAFFEIRPVLKTVSNATLHNLLPALNRVTGMMFDTVDVVDTDLALIAVGEQANVEIVASSTSLGYTGRFTVLYERIRPDLAAVVSVRVLPELKHILSPTLNKRSVQMLLWNVDWTTYQTLFVQEAAGNVWSWKHITALQEAFDLQGLTNWPASQPNGARMANYPTTSLPGANTAFERAWVQDNLDQPTYAGKAYLYYNRA